MKLLEFKKKIFDGKIDKGLLIKSIKLHALDINELLKIANWFEKDLKAFKGLFQRNLLGSYNLPKLYSELNQGTPNYFSDSLELELNWQILGFLQFTQIINQFIKLRSEYENELFIGSFDKARTILDEIDNKICVSYWSIENRLILDERQFGSEKNWETRNQMMDEKNHPNVRVFSDFYSKKAESKYSFFQFNEYFNNWIAQLLKSKNELSVDAEQYFRFKINYFTSEKYENLAYICYLETNTSIIDRYIMLVRILQHSVISKTLDETYLKTILQKLGEKIQDPHLNNIAFSKISIKLYVTEEDEIINIIDLYSSGKYKECIILSRIYLSEKSASNFDILLIMIKSSIEIGIDIKGFYDNDKSLLGQLIEVLSNILNKNEKTEASFLELIKLSYVFNNCRFGLSFYAFIKEQLGWVTVTDYTYLSRLCAEFVNPSLVYSIISNKKETENFINNIEDIYPNSATVKVFKQFYSNFYSQHLICEFEIPDNKAKLYKARSLILLKQLHDAIILLEDIIFNGNFSKITEYEILSNLYYCYFELKDYHNCLKIYSKAFLNNSEMTTRMNTEVLTLEILKGKFKNVELDRMLIELPIFFKINCKDKIRIKQSYELFLKVNGVSKPSDLRENHNSLEPNKLVYFLKNVCITDILQLSKTFNSSYSVNEERIKICQWLVILDNINTKLYNQEIANITQKNAISKVIGRIDEGKIYVNEDKIKQVFLNSEVRGEVSKLNTSPTEKHLTKDFFNRTRDLQKFMENNEYKDVSKIVFMNYDKEGNFYLQGNPAFNAFKQMFLEVREYFVTNNEYGLNPYLSTRIRHGTLPNHIRSVFERLNLVTTQTEGVYANNDFWQEKLGLPTHENKKIQKLLADFSKAVDEISATLKEEWIQYKTENKIEKIDALFDFSYKDDADLLHLYITKFKTYEEFIDFCFIELWERTENCLEKIRNILNGEIKQRFINLITELEQEAENSSDKTRIYELINNMNLSRTEIQILITNIAKWFYRSESSFDGEYELSMLAETSIQIIKNINPYYNFAVTPVVCNNFNVKGEYHEYFIDIIRNFLENMIKRSNLQISELNPKLVIEEDNGELTMIFANNLADNLSIDGLLSKMQAVKNNWSNLDDNISLEDGTGFPKIKKALHSDLDRKKTEFNFNLNHNILEILLSFETQGLKV